MYTCAHCFRYFLTPSCLFCLHDSCTIQFYTHSKSEHTKTRWSQKLTVLTQLILRPMNRFFLSSLLLNNLNKAQKTASGGSERFDNKTRLPQHCSFICIWFIWAIFNSTTFISITILKRLSNDWIECNLPWVCACCLRWEYSLLKIGRCRNKSWTSCVCVCVLTFAIQSKFTKTTFWYVAKVPKHNSLGHYMSVSARESFWDFVFELNVVYVAENMFLFC